LQNAVFDEPRRKRSVLRNPHESVDWSHLKHTEEVPEFFQQANEHELRLEPVGRDPRHTPQVVVPWSSRGLALWAIAAEHVGEHVRHLRKLMTITSSEGPAFVITSSRGLSLLPCLKEDFGVQSINREKRGGEVGGCIQSAPPTGTREERSAAARQSNQ
jgi:hypothetical protein